MNVTRRHVIRTIAAVLTIEGDFVEVQTQDYADAGCDGEQVSELNLIIGNHTLGADSIPGLIDALCEAKKVLDAAREEVAA